MITRDPSGPTGCLVTHTAVSILEEIHLLGIGLEKTSADLDGRDGRCAGVILSWGPKLSLGLAADRTKIRTKIMSDEPMSGIP